MTPSIFAHERRSTLAGTQRRLRARKRVNPFLFALVIVPVGCASFFLLGTGADQPLDPAPSATLNGETGDLTTLCARYRSDHLMTGEGMERATADMCGF